MCLNLATRTGCIDRNWQSIDGPSLWDLRLLISVSSAIGTWAIVTSRNDRTIGTIQIRTCCCRIGTFTPVFYFPTTLAPGIPYCLASIFYHYAFYIALLTNSCSGRYRLAPFLIGGGAYRYKGRPYFSDFSPSNPAPNLQPHPQTSSSHSSYSHSNGFFYRHFHRVFRQGGGD